MKEIALCSILSVIKLVLVVLVGVWLGRKGLLDKPTRQHFSKILMLVMLPCLLIVSLGRNAQIHNIEQWWMLIVSAGLFVVYGFVVSEIVFKLLRLPKHLQNTLGRHIAVEKRRNRPTEHQMPHRKIHQHRQESQ